MKPTYGNDSDCRCRSSDILKKTNFVGSGAKAAVCEGRKSNGKETWKVTCGPNTLKVSAKGAKNNKCKVSTKMPLQCANGGGGYGGGDGYGDDMACQCEKIIMKGLKKNQYSFKTIECKKGGAQETWNFVCNSGKTKTVTNRCKKIGKVMSKFYC